MQLRRIMGFLIASVSASSLLVVGCSRQRNFDEVQPTPPSSGIHTRYVTAKIQGYCSFILTSTVITWQTD